MQQTGFVGGPAGYMQSQPTGMSSPSFMSPQQTGMSANGFGQYQQQQQHQQQQQGSGLVEFNPMPPSRQQANSNDSQKLEAKNVFASMKDGSFANGSNGKSLGPQDASKYEILRPQVTGMPGQSPSFMQPQMTGYGAAPQQQPMYTGMGMQWQQNNGFRQVRVFVRRNVHGIDRLTRA